MQVLLAAFVWGGAVGLGELEAVAASFRRDGFALIEDFASLVERSAMKARMGALEAAYWADESERSRSSVFTTTADAGQQQAQAKSAYFFESTRKVHFFEEAGETPALNKAGHGLHLADDVFGRYSTSPRIASLLRALGLRDAVLPQSMYIFKPPRVGGAVTSHQDATFLRTTPAQTVIGLWLALDDATLENGCLWVRNASHLEPVRRYFVREKTGAAGVEMRFVPVDAEDRGAYLSERLLAAGVSVQPPAAREVEGREMGAAEAASQGFLPVPVRAGTLLAIAGTLDHLSLPNLSPHQRHTFQLHAVEGSKAGVEWAHSNWLQSDEPFLRLAQSATQDADEL